MNNHAIELFKQASEEAFKLCEKYDHDVSEIDTIWTSIMAATLTELVVNDVLDTALYGDENEEARANVKKHFGVTE